MNNTAFMYTAYLDNAASTPMYEESRVAMLEYMDSEWTANPTGSHLTAQKSRRALDDAREKLADVCGVKPGGVIFCSGGTEADNLAIFGSFDPDLSSPPPNFPSFEPSNQTQSKPETNTILCSAIEHPAVLRPVRQIAQKVGGTTICVHESGELDLDHLESLLCESTRLVSVMSVNNETGIIQPLSKVAQIVREKSPNAVLHTDAAQAMLWLDISELTRDFDLITLSAHKFGGPMGMGALVVRNPDQSKISPQLLGGKQERDRRSGTQNVPGAIGMAVAAGISANQNLELSMRVSKMRDHLQSGVQKKIPTVQMTDTAPRIAGICHLCIPGISSEEFLFLMTESGVEASGASSCASGAEEPSHVLEAMGYPRNLANGSLRFSLGHQTIQKDIDLALEVIPSVFDQLYSYNCGELVDTFDNQPRK